MFYVATTEADTTPLQKKMQTALLCAFIFFTNRPIPPKALTGAAREEYEWQHSLSRMFSYLPHPALPLSFRDQRRALQFAALVCAFLAFSAPLSLAAKEKEFHESPNALQVVVNAPVAEVVTAVQDVAADTIVYGTQSYQREKNLSGAHRWQNSTAFGEYTGKGTVIYKVAEGVLSPTNFKNSADMGTLTVRYIVTPFDDKNTNVRIDAVFIENFHRRIHESDGSVEAAEFGEIRQHVEELDAKREIERTEEERIARERKEKQQELDLASRQEAARQSAAHSSVSTDLEQRVTQLRRQAEVRVKASGTQLKTAPYKGAASLQNLPPYTEVVVLIVTPYWLGVQTADGHRGWVHHAEVEKLQ